MSRNDPNAPAWILDIAEDVMRYRLDRLSQEMLKRDEDITDNGLWRLRRVQLDELLQSGRVLAVKASRDARETGTANREITATLNATTKETT